MKHPGQKNITRSKGFGVTPFAVKTDTTIELANRLTDQPRTRCEKIEAKIEKGKLVSLNVGLPRDVTWRGQTVHTGIWKQAVPAGRWSGA
jgi:hypothetical protein